MLNILDIFIYTLFKYIHSYYNIYLFYPRIYPYIYAIPAARRPELLSETLSQRVERMAVVDQAKILDKREKTKQVRYVYTNSYY